MPWLLPDSSGVQVSENSELDSYPTDVDIAFLLEPHPPSPITIKVTDAVYSVKAQPEDNWVWYAFAAFRLLALDRLIRIRSFASIGCGAGVDAIGAAQIFPELNKIIVTDVNQPIVDLAVSNIQKNVSPSVSLTGVAGDLCQPILELGQAADVIYANLPTLPALADPVAELDYKSFYAPTGDNSLPYHLVNCGLELQFRLLQSAKAILAPRASVVLMIGDRFPPGVLESLAELAGYHFSPLIAHLKSQSEVDVATSAYAALEGTVQFDFYLYEEARQFLSISPALPGISLKQRLAPYRLSARDAHVAASKGKSIGHILYAIRAIPI